MRKNDIILFVIALFLGAISLLAQKTVEITYIANSGFLIKGHNEKVLIDAMFDEDYGQFQKPSTETIFDIRYGYEPFDGITHVFVSHKDADHYRTSYYGDQMLFSSTSYFISSNQVGDLLKGYSSYNAFADEIVFLTPLAGEKIDITINNKQFKIMSLQHAEDPELKKENLGIIFSIDSIKFFHMGDASSNNLSEFQNLKVAEDSVDVVFVPYWIYESINGRKILDYINAKAIIIMHIPINKTAIYKNMKSTFGDSLAPAYFFDTMMTKSTIKRYIDKSITIEGAFLREDTLKKELKPEVIDNININLVENFNLYPNPASAELTISLTNELVGEEIKIYNIMGEIIFKGAINKNKMKLDVSNFKKGTYILNTGGIIRKLIIK